MSNPSFDEMDTLMGAPGAKDTHDDSVIEDAGAERRGADQQKRERKAKAVRLVAGAAIAMVVIGGGAFYVSSLRNAATITTPAPPDVLAQTLGPDYGDAPAFQDQTPIPGFAAAEVDPARYMTQGGQAGDAQPVELDQTTPVESDQVRLSEQGQVTQAGAPAGATVNIPLEDFTALNKRVEELVAQLEAAEQERDEAKAAPPRTVTRNVTVQTSFVLVDTLVDGAVLRDQSGNEIIVPLRARVRTNGDRLNVEG